MALGVACLVLLAAGPAKAGWSSPVTVSGASGSTSQTAVSGGADGTSWVVWKRNVAGFDVIQGTRVSIEGTQGPIVTFSPANLNATDPVIDTRADGSAMVGWTNTAGFADFIQTAAISAEGTVGPAVNRSVAAPPAQDAADLAIALGDDGTAGLTWRKFNGTNWVVQAVKVAADGDSGTIHDMSDPAVSAGPPDIGAAPPPPITGGPYTYRAFWPQGSGPTSNVGSRAINADDSVTELYLAFIEPGGDPFDVQVGYDSDGGLSAMWIRHREDINPDTGNPFENWAVEWLRANEGVTLNPIAPLPVTAISPVIAGQPYNISSLFMAETFGGMPVVAWVHDINGGGQRVETGRLVPAIVGAAFQAWADPSAIIAAAEDPRIAANASATGISGWTAPGAAPNQGSVAWARFSNSSFEPFAPSGSFAFSRDPGFVMADNGLTLAAFTAIDGGGVGTSRIMTYENAGIAAYPSVHNFGRVNIGQPNTRYVTIRSSGQTPNQVTGISLSGPDANRYMLNDAAPCVTAMMATHNCRFSVTFRPGSTAVQSARITVTSQAGSRVILLRGAGLNRTRNRITVRPRRIAVPRGRVVRLRVRAANTGGVASRRTAVCVNYNQRALQVGGKRCRRIGSLPAGANRVLNYRLRVTWRARPGARMPVIFRMWSRNAVVRLARVNVRRRRR